MFFFTQSRVEKELASGQRQMSAGFGTDYLKAATCKGDRIKNNFLTQKHLLQSCYSVVFFFPCEGI